jgi:hypothetical protein
MTGQVSVVSFPRSFVTDLGSPNPRQRCPPILTQLSSEPDIMNIRHTSNDVACLCHDDTAHLRLASHTTRRHRRRRLGCRVHVVFVVNVLVDDVLVVVGVDVVIFIIDDATVNVLVDVVVVVSLSGV